MNLDDVIEDIPGEKLSDGITELLFVIRKDNLDDSDEQINLLSLTFRIPLYTQNLTQSLKR